MTDAAHVDASQLTQFCVAVLEAVGAPGDLATTVAASLVDADLRGLDSHGVLARLPGYVERVRRGGIVADARAETMRHDRGPVAVIEGHDGFGQVAAMAAMRLSMDVAREHGIGLVAVRGSNHLGALGYYTRIMARAGFVGYAATGGGPRIAPWGGAEPLLATNPWSFGFPAGERPPMIVDVSNGVVLTGSVDGSAARGEQIPIGWALDERGCPTTDAVAGAAGSLLAFGGAKGTALTFALEVLVSVLTGASYSRQVPPLDDSTRPQRLGHLFVALEVGRLLPPAELSERMNDLLSSVATSRPVEGGPPVRIPGERGEAVAARRRAVGIPVDCQVGRQLDRLAADLAIPRLETSSP